MAEGNERVQEFIAKLQSEIDEMERKRQDETMLALGLYEEEETEEDDKKLTTFERLYGVDSEGVRRKRNRKQKVPIEVSREEFAQIQKLLSRKARLERDANQEKVQPENPEPPFQVEMSTKDSNSGSASFFRVIAWILWIGGLILAFMTSSVEGRYGDSEFRFSLFLPTVLTYGLYGCMAMVAAELLENIAAIRAALVSIRFKKK